MVCQWKLESSVMSTPIRPLTLLVVAVAGWIQRDQQAAIVYLPEENRVLKARLRGRKLRLTDAERRRLAVKGKALGRKLLAEVAGIVTPETLLAWHRRPSCPRIQTNSRLARRAVSIVIAPWRAPDLGRVGGDVGDSGSPYTQGKHHPATGCHVPGRRPGSRPGPHLDQNVLVGYAKVALALILDPSGGLFSDAARPCQRPAPPFGANVALENRD